MRGASTLGPKTDAGGPKNVGIIERRADGRPRYAGPLNALTNELDKLGYRSFRLRWTLTVTEPRLTNPNSAPVSAIGPRGRSRRGALNIIVKHARERLGGLRKGDHIIMDERV